MGLRIPQNKIISKYTSGGEYIFVDTYREYQGYYYEINNKTFAGKNFNIKALEIIKKNSDKVNTLLTKPSTYIYGKVSGTKIINTNPKSQVYKQDFFATGYTDRYFVQKLNIVPILIKEVDNESYEKAKNDPLYNTLMIKWNNEKENTKAVAEAEKQMPGITAFLQDSGQPSDDPGF